MKDIYWVLLVMLAGIGIHTLLSNVLTGMANHQATLQTLVQLILALVPRLKEIEGFIRPLVSLPLLDKGSLVAGRRD